MDADTKSPLEGREKKSAPVEETVAFYRQTTSADAATGSASFIASAQSISALIKHYQ
jgi:hypothetical protein